MRSAAEQLRQEKMCDSTLTEDETQGVRSVACRNGAPLDG